MRAIAAVLTALVLAAPAAAQERDRFDVTLLAGGRFPQLMNSLETGFEFDLRAGAFPSARLSVETYLELGYSWTPQTITGDDPRLGTTGASYESRLFLHDVRPGLGVAWRFAGPAARLLPYVGATVRVHLFRTDVEGDASASFGEYSETETSAGGSVYGGVRVRLGPGAFLSELALAYVPVAQRVTGDSNAGALSLRIGYGVSF
jgi:hypothetical protein